MQAVQDACQCDLLISNGKFVLKPRKSRDSVFSFNTSNILTENGDSTFESEQADRSHRPNRIKLFFHTEDSYNAETEVIVDDANDQRTRAARAGNNGIVDINLKFPAVTDHNQAERIAHNLLTQSVSGRWGVKFKTTTKALALEPGDVVDVTHPSQPAWSAKLFLISRVGHDANDHLEIEASEYVNSYV